MTRGRARCSGRTSSETEVLAVEIEETGIRLDVILVDHLRRWSEILVERAEAGERVETSAHLHTAIRLAAARDALLADATGGQDQNRVGLCVCFGCCGGGAARAEETGAASGTETVIAETIIEETIVEEETEDGDNTTEERGRRRGRRK